ncbi:MAG: hypothetical protein ACLP01_03145 [Solirubrobacteraceae bacterium]
MPAVTVLAALAFAGTAAAHPRHFHNKRPAPRRVSCRYAHGQSTLLEDGSARVFSLSGSTYACARPSGTPTLVFAPSSGQPSGIDDIALVGPYVAWELTQDEGIGADEQSLYLLDVNQQAPRQVYTNLYSTFRAPNFALGEYVLNASGTIVWVVNPAPQAACSSNCGEAYTVYENSVANGTSTLATTSASTPITSLGLSADGTVAYWLENDSPQSADIG